MSTLTLTVALFGFIVNPATACLFGGLLCFRHAYRTARDGIRHNRTAALN